MPFNPRFSFSAVYEYYARTLAPDDVLLKVDDDIVWVDTPRFASFLDYRRRHADDVFVLAPNVVNNGVNAYFQHRLGGCIPDGLLVHHRLPFDKRYYGFRVSRDESMEPWLHKFSPSEAPDEAAFFGYDGFKRRDAAGEYPAGGSHGLLWGSPGNAVALHRHFLTTSGVKFPRRENKPGIIGFCCICYCYCYTSVMLAM